MPSHTNISQTCSRRVVDSISLVLPGKPRSEVKASEPRLTMRPDTSMLGCEGRWGEPERVYGVFPQAREARMGNGHTGATAAEQMRGRQAAAARPAAPSEHTSTASAPHTLPAHICTSTKGAAASSGHSTPVAPSG